MARPRGESNSPERHEDEFFSSKDIPESWKQLPRTAKDAKENGQKYYFTGEPCRKHSHISVRLASNFGCCACNKIKRNSPATKERLSQYSKQNREKILSQVKARRADSNDSFSQNEAAIRKRYYEKDIEAARARSREKAKKRYYNDPEAARAYARNQSKKDTHKVTRNARLKRRRETDPGFIAEERSRTRVRGVFRRLSIPKQGGTKDLLGTDDWNFLAAHIEALFDEGMSWELKGQWHVDHIRPCSSFDCSDKNQCLVAFNWRNLQPLWGDENVFKSDEYEPHHEVEWSLRMRELGFEGDLFLRFEEGNGGLN